MNEAPRLEASLRRQPGARTGTQARQLIQERRVVTVYRRSPAALRGLAGLAIGRETSGTAVLGERTLFCAPAAWLRPPLKTERLQQRVMLLPELRPAVDGLAIGLQMMPIRMRSVISDGLQIRAGERGAL